MPLVVVTVVNVGALDHSAESRWKLLGDDDGPLISIS